MAAAVDCNSYVAVDAFWPTLQTENAAPSPKWASAGLCSNSLFLGQYGNSEWSPLPFPLLSFGFGELVSHARAYTLEVARPRGKGKTPERRGPKNLSLGLVCPFLVSVVAPTIALSELEVSRDPGNAGEEPPAELRVSSHDTVILASAGSDETDPCMGNRASYKYNGR